MRRVRNLRRHPIGSSTADRRGDFYSSFCYYFDVAVSRAWTDDDYHGVICAKSTRASLYNAECVYNIKRTSQCFFSMINV